MIIDWLEKVGSNMVQSQAIREYGEIFAEVEESEAGKYRDNIQPKVFNDSALLAALNTPISQTLRGYKVVNRHTLQLLSVDSPNYKPYMGDAEILIRKYVSERKETFTSKLLSKRCSVTPQYAEKIILRLRKEGIVEKISHGIYKLVN